MAKLFGGMSVAQLKGNLERHYAGHPDYQCVEDIVKDSIDVLNDLIGYVEQYSPEYVHSLESDLESLRVELSMLEGDYFQKSVMEE